MSKPYTFASFAIAAALSAFAIAAATQAGEYVRIQPKSNIQASGAASVLNGGVSEEQIPPGFRKPCITYRQHGPQRTWACGTITVMLSIQDPCTCCVYEIPVCMPECCIDTPKVAIEKAGPHGRAVGTYVWCGGYKAKIILDRCGDITVHTFGR